MSINVRELLAIERALLWFAPQLCGSSVAIFADNAMAIAYLRNQGGTHSSQRILRWAKSLPVVLSPQFIMGKHNVLADALSRPNQIQGSEWTLKLEVFQELRKRWPVSIDLSATSLNHRCSLYFCHFHDRNALRTDALLQKWNGWQAYAFPPWSLIPAVLKKLRSSSGVLLTIIAPYWPQRLWFPDFWIWWWTVQWLFLNPETVFANPTFTASIWGCPGCRFMLGDYPAICPCPGFLQACSTAGGLSSSSIFVSRVLARWLIYRRWCRAEGHSISRPSLAKIADFLFWLRRSRRLSVSAVMGYRSMLSAVFKSILPEISTSSILHDLLRSFQVEAPVRQGRPPPWDLLTVLTFFRSSPFEPLSNASLRDITRKTLFLVALATAKRVGELQALSRIVSFSSSSAGLSYVPEFVAKTETATRPLPRTFEVKSLSDFAAGFPEELLLCPVRSLSAYVVRTAQFVNRLRRLFVSPRCPSRAMSKNGISYMLREVIVQSGASSQSDQAPKAHSICFFPQLVFAERAGGGLLAFKFHFYLFLLAGFAICFGWCSFSGAICCCW